MTTHPVARSGIGLLIVAAMGLSAALAGEEKSAPPAQAVDLKSLPPSQWVKVSENPGGFGWSGIVYCPEAGGTLYSGGRTIQVFDSRSAKWVDGSPEKTETVKTPTDPVGARRYIDFRSSGRSGGNQGWDPLAYMIGDDGRKVPMNSPQWGNEACYDPDRRRVVALVTGDTLEYDGASRRWTILEPKASPQATYASSLAYDPVNKEVVLANGGFSVEGCPRTTWVYRGAEKTWAPLTLGGKELNEVRLPAEALRDRLGVFRWLVWKNLEFRATGREKLLEERSLEAALTKEAGELAAEAGRLAELAGKNAGLVKHDDARRKAYEAAQLKAAGTHLATVASGLAGMDTAIKGASPEDLERVYRGKLIPAGDSLEQAFETLRVMPGPRMNAKLVTDTKNRVMVCFGGHGQDRTWGDTWVYHLDGRWWEKMKPAGHPPVTGRAMTAVYDPGLGLVIHMLGSQAWAYDAAKDEWSIISVGGSEQKTPWPIFIDYDPEAGCIVGIETSWQYAGQKFVTCVLRLEAASLKRLAAKPGPEVELLPVTGDFVLRDAAAVADLKKWKDEQDAWLKEVPANTWVQTPTRGTGRPNWGRSWSSMVYDPDRWQMYYRDGGHGSYHGAVTDHYDLPTGRWFRGQRREEPTAPHTSYFAWGRSFGCAPFCTHTYKYSLYYSPLTKRLNRAGVSAPKAYEGCKGVAHEYDPDVGQWSKELYGEAGNVPGSPDGLVSASWGGGQVTVVDAKGKRSWNAGVLPVVEVDDSSRGHWRCFFVDAKRNRAVYYGGGPKGQWGFWVLDLAQADSKWTKLEFKPAGEGKLPCPSREAVYVPKHDVYLMVRGMGQTYLQTGQDPNLSIWCFDPKANTFGEVKIGRNAGVAIKDAGVSQGLQYDPVTDLCYFIGIAENYRIMWYAFRYVPASGSQSAAKPPEAK